MNIDRSKHNKYTTGAVYGNQTTGGISTDSQGNVSGDSIYSGGIIYINGGGGGGSISQELIDKLTNQNAFSYFHLSDGIDTILAEAKQEKDHIHLNIVGDNETVETHAVTERYLSKTYYESTGQIIGSYNISYGKILIPGEVGGEPVEITKWVLTITKQYGKAIFAGTDFNGVLLMKDGIDLGAPIELTDSRVSVTSNELTGLEQIVIQFSDEFDFTEIRFIKLNSSATSNNSTVITIIKGIVIQTYTTLVITQAGANRYWQLDPEGKLFTMYDTYTTKSLGAYDMIWTNKGYTVGNFVSNISGGTFHIADELGNTYLEVDKLKVRKKAYFETLEIVNVNSIGGKQIISPAGAVTLRKVVPYSTYYRCYFIGEQDGVEIENRFQVNDQAFSQNFNIKKPGIYEEVANHYFWRLVVGKSVEVDADGNHYIDLDKIDCDTDSDIPHVNDVVAQLGNRVDTDRQSALIFSSVDVESPRMILCHGINRYSLSSTEYFDVGVDHANNQAYMNVYGNAYIGAKDQSSYINYTQANGLNIKANITATSTYGGKTFSEIFVTTENLSDSVMAVVGEDLEFLQNQIDGSIESYFYEYTPTATNIPASQWTTEAIKQRHNGDTFTNIQKYINDATTPDAGKSWRWVKNSSNVWLWTPISDSDAVAALKKAGEAQDTADGKRRVFVRKPIATDVYDIGDLWVNATSVGTDGIPLYSNDLLRAKVAKVAGAAFSIAHWELASKYTDDTLAADALAKANAAREAADNAGEAANDLSKDVADYKVTINDVFQDGVITASERYRLQTIKDTINTTLFDVQMTYNSIYNNSNLTDKVQKTQLKAAYDAFVTATNALITIVTTIINKAADKAYLITKGDISSVDNAYSNFNTKYTDYVVKLNAANLEIMTSLSTTAYTNAVNQFAWLNGLFDPDQTTTINGGVVTTGVLALGITESSVFKVNAGISGVVNKSYVGNGMALWFGGDMLDKANYTAGNRPLNTATSVLRFDGSGYLGYKRNTVASKDEAPIWWDADGNIHANPLSFFVGEETVGLLLASFQAVDSTGDGIVDYVIPKVPFDHLQIDKAYIDYDAVNNSVYVYTLDASGNKVACNFYSYGEITAYGSSSGEAPVGASYLAELKDVKFTNLAVDNLMKYDGTYWRNVPMSTITGSSAWDDITGKPTWIGATKPTYSYSEITGTPPAVDLSSYVTLNTTQTIINTKIFTASPNIRGGGSLLITPRGSGSNANGVHYTAQDFTTFISGIGSYANSGVFEWMYMGWGAEPWQKATSFSINSTSLWYKNNELLHAANYNNYAPTKTGGGASGAWNILSSRTNGLEVNYTGIIDSNYGNYGGIIQGNGVNMGMPDGRWYNKIKILHNNSNGYYTELAQNFTGTNNLYYRKMENGTLGGWTTVVDNGNYTQILDSRYVNKAGDTMAGLLRINTNTGGYIDFARNGVNVGYIGQGSASNSAIYLSNYTSNKGIALLNSGEITYGGVPMWYAGNDGSGSGLDADLLDGAHNYDFLRYGGLRSHGVITTEYTVGTFMTNFAGAGLYLDRGSWDYANNGFITTPYGKIHLAGTMSLFTGSGSAASKYCTYLAITPSTGGLPGGSKTNDMLFYTSNGDNTSYPDAWTRVMTDRIIGYYNAGSATKLQTARSIFGQPFDGTSNIVGRGIFYGVGVGYAQGALEIRENNLVSAGNGTLAQAPSIGFHWGGRIGASIKLTNQGIFYFANQNGDGATTVEAKGIKTNNICIETTNGGIYGNTSEINTVAGHLHLQHRSGSVGIGGVSPLYKLDVNGDIYARGFLYSKESGLEVMIGSQNASYCHYSTTAPIHWFNKPMEIQGTLKPYGGAHQVGSSAARWGTIWGTSVDCSTMSSFRGTVNTGDWYRSVGGVGWYSETYGGGIYMVDGNYVRIYGNKAFYVANTTWDAINTAGGCHSSWSGATENGSSYAQLLNYQNSVFNSNYRVTPINGVTRMLGWADQIPGGYMSRYCISSYRVGTSWGEMLLSVGNNDAGTSGHYLGLGSNGTMRWTGSIVATGEVTAYSDIRLKSDITNLQYKGRLLPKRYLKDNKYQIGFIAQEVQALYPELITISNNEEHYLSLNYGSITAVLSEQINRVEDEVTILKNKISKLENRLSKYESIK